MGAPATVLRDRWQERRRGNTDVLPPFKDTYWVCTQCICLHFIDQNLVSQPYLTAGSWGSGKCNLHFAWPCAQLKVGADHRKGRNEWVLGTSTSLCHSHLWTWIKWQYPSSVETIPNGQHQSHITSLRKEPFWSQRKCSRFLLIWKQKQFIRYTLKRRCVKIPLLFSIFLFWKIYTYDTGLWQNQAARKSEKHKLPPAAIPTSNPTLTYLG